MTVPWDTAAADGKRVHMIQKAALFGPVFSLPPATSPPSVCVCVCVGLAGSLQRCKTPLLATAIIPLPCTGSLQTSEPLLRRQPTLQSSASSARCAVRRDCRWRWKHIRPASSPLLFVGTALKLPLCSLSFLCHYPPHFFFFFKMLGTVGLENSMLENHGRRPRWYILKSILGHLWASFHSVC